MKKAGEGAGVTPLTGTGVGFEVGNIQGSTGEKRTSLPGFESIAIQQFADRARGQSFEEAGAGLMRDIQEMVGGWVGAGVRAGTNKSEVLKNKMEMLRDQRPKLDQKVALLGSRLAMAKEEVGKLQTEHGRLTTMTKAALQAEDDNAAQGYLLQRKNVETKIQAAEAKVAVAQTQYDGAMELRKVTLEQIAKEIETARDALDRAEAAKVDKDVAGALQEVSRAVDGGVGDLVSAINKESARGEALLGIYMEDNQALTDARILNTARKKEGASLLDEFKKSELGA